MDFNMPTTVVRKAWECIRTGDSAAFLSLLADDVVWQIQEMPDVPFSGVWIGLKRVSEFFRIVADVQESIEFEPEEFVSENETVVVLGRFQNRVRLTGKIAFSLWAQVWKVKDGKIASMREYVDTLAVSRAFSADLAEKLETARKPA